MKRILLIALLSFTCLAIYGQELLSLEQCRMYALENNNEYKLAQAKYEKYSYQRKSAGTNYFPKVSFDAKYMLKEDNTEMTLKGGYLPTFNFNPSTGALDPNLLVNPQTGQPVIGPDGNPIFNQYAYFPDKSLEVLPDRAWMAGVTLKQPIFMSGKIHSGYKMASLASEIAGLNVKSQREKIINKSDEAYWRYVSLLEKVKLADMYYSYVNRLFQSVQNGYDVGLLDKNILLQAEVKLNEVKLAQKKASNGVNLAKMALCQTIGLPLDSQIEPADSTLTINEGTKVDDYLIDDYKNRYDYQMLCMKKDIAKKKITFVRSDYLPELGVQISYNYLDYDLNDEDKADGEFSAIASVSVPLFQWGDSIYKVKSAKAEYKSEKINLDNSVAMMKLQISQLKFSLDNLEERLVLTKSSLIKAVSYRETAENSYAAGMIPLSDLLGAQAQWNRSYSDYLDAKIEYKITLNKLDIATGKDL